MLGEPRVPGLHSFSGVRADDGFVGFVRVEVRRFVIEVSQNHGLALGGVVVDGVDPRVDSHVRAGLVEVFAGFSGSLLARSRDVQVRACAVQAVFEVALGVVGVVSVLLRGFRLLGFLHGKSRVREFFEAGERCLPEPGEDVKYLASLVAQADELL